MQADQRLAQELAQLVALVSVERGEDLVLERVLRGARPLERRAPLGGDDDDVAAAVTGPILIRSDGRGGTISGNLAFDRGRFTLGRATAALAVLDFDVDDWSGVRHGGGRLDRFVVPGHGED